MNKLSAFLKGTEALAIFLWWYLVATGVPMFLVNAYDLWGSPFSAQFAKVTSLFIVFLAAFIALSFLSYPLTKIYNYMASKRGTKLYLGLQVFEYRCAAVSLICAGLILVACWMGHRGADKTQDFVNLYHKLNGHRKIIELQKLIADNGKADEAYNAYQEIVKLAGKDVELHFFEPGSSRLMLFWDVPSKRSVTELFVERGFGNGSCNGTQPYSFEKFGNSSLAYIPLRGVMRFNNVHGLMCVFVEMPPNQIAFTP